jgi:hypothetical protein
LWGKKKDKFFSPKNPLSPLKKNLRTIFERSEKECVNCVKSNLYSNLENIIKRIKKIVT